ncbi:hypothetical protein PENTCL1PPCAC_3465, partial [Pristionchus entomophagus]
MPSKYPKIVSEAKKIASRNKEKKRNVDMNQAFNALQSSFTSIPFITRKKKVPKVTILRLSIKYIQHIQKVLNGELHVSEGLRCQPSPHYPPRPIKLEDFEIVAAEELNEKHSYTNRLHEDEEYNTLINSTSTSASPPSSCNDENYPSSHKWASPTTFN